jgi:hypothetical protein
MALAILSVESQTVVTSAVAKHNGKKAWMMEDFRDTFLIDPAITPQHLIAVGLKGVINAGNAVGGYILSVCPEMDVKSLSATFLGKTKNFNRIKVSSNLSAMKAELARVSALDEKETLDEANTNALNGTATIQAMDSLVAVAEKVRKVPLVTSPAATEAFLKAQEIFESIKSQYLGVEELVSTK